MLMARYSTCRVKTTNRYSELDFVYKDRLVIARHSRKDTIVTMVSLNSVMA